MDFHHQIPEHFINAFQGVQLNVIRPLKDLGAKVYVGKHAPD